MPDLYHHPLCPHSRYARLVLAEHGVEPELIEERARERRHEFLLLNPAGETPVLVAHDHAVCGAGPVGEYADEVHGAALGEARLMPADPAQRAEVRRLTDWFHRKFFSEVTSYLIAEKVTRRFLPVSEGGGGPDMELVRAARTNIRSHLRYAGHLARRRHWLAGERLSLADFAAAAHFSCADFLGDVPWAEDADAKDWYARVKSRPSFRALLNDRVPGLSPGPAYADLDF